MARNKRCAGYPGSPVLDFSDASCQRWTFEATVFKSRACRGFVGYGDADPSNVSSLVHGAEMRVAETRAVNRALRKAYGIGICSVEEIGSRRRADLASPESKKLPPQPTSGNGSRTVRDRLCQVIRQHQLDPNLVKSYATDFCGVKALRDATREQVENFVAHLAIGPRKIGMPCSASSTAIQPRKKVPHETPDYRVARRRSLCRRPDP